MESADVRFFTRVLFAERVVAEERLRALLADAFDGRFELATVVNQVNEVVRPYHYSVCRAFNQRTEEFCYCVVTFGLDDVMKVGGVFSNNERAVYKKLVSLLSGDV